MTFIIVMTYVYGRVWQGMAGYGRVWQGMARYEDITREMQSINGVSLILRSHYRTVPWNSSGTVPGTVLRRVHTELLPGINNYYYLTGLYTT